MSDVPVLGAIEVAGLELAVADSAPQLGDGTAIGPTNVSAIDE